MTRTTPRAAFSLVEVLVVIAVIAIVGTMLVPVFPASGNKIRDAADQPKKLGRALAVYVDDPEEGKYFFGGD